ncbi:MAG: tetratricopeptide repeat protein, partial [Planctomycetales bacterium]|nr:tetratricopeptide repeat protein [Planctomycetales bacterium]
QRLWAEENGFVAKEFRLTEESAHALIDLDIPFAITTAEPESSHIQVICGYDTKRGALLIQDPGTWYVGECNLAPMLETYAWCGPRAIVLVPEAKASILDMVELPETEQFDWLYQLELAARNHDRATAQQIYQQFEAWDANHRLTHWAKWSLAFQDHSLENSLDAMTSLCQLYPDSEALLLKRARLLASMGRLDGAISTLRKCIDDGEGGLASMTYLLTLLSDDCEEEITRLLADVMRQAPHSEFGLVHEAARLQRAKQYEHAYELLRLAAQLSPTDEQIIGRLSELAEQFGKQAEFLAFLKKRFDEFGHISEQPGLLFAKGLANYLQSDAAVEVLHQAIQRRPDDGRLLCEAARLIGILRTPQEGLQLLEQATTALPELEKWLTVANLAERDGRLEDSLNAYRQVVTAGGDESSYSQTIAKLTAHVEGVDAAVQYACDLADRFPDHGNALTLAADWLGYVHQHQAALEYLDKSLQLDGTYGWAWRERAIACQALGRHEEALEAANKAIEFERNVYSFQIRAKILVSLKRIDEAKSDFRDAILENVNSAFAINGWIDLCQTDKERREALQCILQQLVSQAVDDEAVQAYYFQAKWLLPADVVEESLRIVQEKSPHLLCAWTLCAELLSSQRRNQEAIDCLVSQKERFAAVPEYWSQIGQLHADTDNPAAIRAFEQAYALDPNSVDAADELIRALHDQEML